MEVSRKKNVATTLYFPLIDAANRPAYFTGTAWGALTNKLLSAVYDDGLGETVLPLTGTPTESSNVVGLWKLALTQAQANHDLITVKLAASEIDEQTILINTTPQGALDLLSNLGVCDIRLLKTTTPWRLVWCLKGTDPSVPGNQLAVKELYRVDGSAVSSDAHLVAEHREPPA
jgi:hypothetical protein